MPLVTRQVNQAHVFVQTTEPTEWNDGDLWVDTTNNKLFLNVSGTATSLTDLNEDSVISYFGNDIPIEATF